jgi:hypothetical protein
MIELKCWACGWDGNVPDHFAGLRVRCKRCGDTNVVPDSVTKEVDADLWVSEIDAASELDTAEVKYFLSRSVHPANGKPAPVSCAMSSVRMTSPGAN